MATTLGSKAVGSIVKLKENGVAQEYIVVHQGWPDSKYPYTEYDMYDISCDGTWLLRKNIAEAFIQWHNVFEGDSNKYDTSYINSYLNTIWINRYDSAIQFNIKQVKVPYVSISPGLYHVAYGADGFSCKIFLLSGMEVGFENTGSHQEWDGSVLDYFIYGDYLEEARNKRIATIDGSNKPYWWTRSAAPKERYTVNYVTEVGYRAEQRADNTAGLRPAFILPNTLYVDDSGIVFVNTAPSVPSSISVPSTITDGDTITVSWGAASDAEGNLSGYKLEKSTNGGSSWSQIYQGSARSKTDTISGITQVRYRVKAYDAQGAESGYKTSSNVSIQFRPSAPGSITVPEGFSDGASITISWGASTDKNNNLVGYKLEKSTDGGSAWNQIYQGSATSVGDIVSGVSQVRYRVKAYDSTGLESSYTTSTNVLVNRNPIIQCSNASGSDLGIKYSEFSILYTVTDPDNNAITVTEKIDEATLRTYTATLGEQNTFDVSGLTFMKLSNGEHTLQIIANDGKVSTTYTLTFTKSVTGATVTFAEPISHDSRILLCHITVEGSIPEDASLTVEVTNNANDPEPVWENCTYSVKNNINHIFLNRIAINGYAFNFKVTLQRGESNTGGYISSVYGEFI